MQFYAVNTAAGLVPSYDDDYDQKKRLTIGETYKIKVTKARNLQFHRKYFALINCAWEYLPERAVNHFATSEQFRKTCEIAAGHCERVYSIARREWLEVPKSIAFDKMDGLEFDELYKGVRHVIFTVFLKHISPEEFEKNLLNF